VLNTGSRSNGGSAGVFRCPRRIKHGDVASAQRAREIPVYPPVTLPILLNLDPRKPLAERYLVAAAISRTLAVSPCSINGEQVV